MSRLLVIDDNRDMRDLMFIAREIGAHAVLAKPLDNEALLGAVRGLLP